MDKETFTKHLELLLVHLRDTTSRFCFNDLPDKYKFIIEPSERTIGSHLTDVENGYLKTWNKFSDKLLSFDQVVDLLYKDGKTTKWADCSCFCASSDLTVLHILFSRQFRDETEIYYLDRGTGPFKAVVAIPPDRLKVVRGNKFDVNWKKRPDDSKTSLFAKCKRLF